MVGENIVGNVSIPHRYGKNELMNEVDISRWRVSIPHRYGKNFANLFITIRVILRFPFLIGTVRTDAKGSEHS